MSDEFEQRLDTDFIFNGSKQDIIDLWLESRSNWYSTTLIEWVDGVGRCSVTGVPCLGLSTVPAFCAQGSMRYICCTSGESLHVVEACKRDEVAT